MNSLQSEAFKKELKDAVVKDLKEMQRRGGVSQEQMQAAAVMASCIQS